MLIDTHAHLNFRDFEDDWNKIIKRSLADNIWLINVGSNYQTSKKAVEIAENYKEGVFAAIGLHPIHTKDESFDKEKYRSLAHSDKVVAIGEIGLDYFKDYAVFKDKQKELFLEQLDLTKELDLPVIFHCRKAHHDLLEILKKFQVSNSKFQGVVHCFTGNWQEAKEYLDMGFYLGFNGIIYKLDLKEVIEKTPLDKILIETDCPYLIPPLARRSPKGEGGRNEPIFVRYIAQEIARIKGTGLDQIAKITTQNTRNLFKI